MKITHYVTVFLTLLFVSDVAIAASPDEKLKKDLLGAWTLDRDHPSDDVEREAIRLRIFGVTRYASRGIGSTDIYVQKLCGQLVRHHAFRWDVKDGILITSDGKAISKDRILDVSSAKAVLSPVDDASGERQVRLKVGKLACQ